MSASPAGNSTLTLVVAADRRGLDELQAAFASLKSSVSGVLGGIQAATGSLATGGSSDLARMKAALDETTGAVRVLQAENEVLTAKVAEGAQQRVVASQKVTAAMETEAQASRAMADAETRAIQMVVASEQKLAGEMNSLRVSRMSEDAKAAQAMADAETRATQMVLAAEQKLKAQMDELRFKRMADAAKAAAAQAAGEEAAAAKAAAAQAKGNVTQSSVAAREAAIAEAAAQRDLTSAVRGAAQAANLGFLSYGALLPLMISFAAASATVSSLKLGADFQYQLQFVGAIADVTGAKLTAAGEQFKAFSEQSLFSTEQVAQGARTMVQAGISLEDTLTTLPQLLKFSTLGEIELSKGAEIASGTMHAFGLTVADIPHILDSTAKAAQISQTTISEMGEALRQASSVGQQFGVSVDEINAMLAALAERNIRGGQAGTALMNMFRSLDPTTAKGKQAFQELNVQIADTEGNFKSIIPLLQEYAAKYAEYDQVSQSRLAGGQFNNRGARAFLTLMAEAGGDLQKFFDAARDSSGTLDTQFAKIGDTVKLDMIEAVHAFQNDAISAFQAIAPDLATLGQNMKTFATDPAVKQGLTDLLTLFLGMAKAAAALASTVLSIANAAHSGGQAINDAKAPGSKTGVIEKWVDGFAALTGQQSLIFTDPTKVNSQAQIDAVRGARQDREAQGYIDSAQRDVTQRQLASMRAQEIGTTNNVTGTGDWDMTLPGYKAPTLKHAPTQDEIREAQRQAQADIELENETYAQKVRDDTKYYANSLAELKAYHSAGLITDTAFNAQEAQLQSDQNKELTVDFQDHVENIEQLRGGLGKDKLKQAAVNKQIDSAQGALSRTLDQAEAQAIQNTAAEWTKYNTAAQGVLDSAQKSDDQMIAQIADLKDFSATKKDHTLVTLQAQQAIDLETLAKLQNQAATFDLTQALTPEQLARLKEIDVIKARLPLYDQEIAKHKALTAELKATQDDWTVGAIKGLNQYLDTVGSTASIMESSFKKGFSSMEDALVTFITTGKFNFKSFADSIIADIVRMIVKMEVTIPLAEALKAALAGGSVAGGVAGAAGGAGAGGASGAASLLGTAGNLYSGVNSFVGGSPASSYLFGTSGSATDGLIGAGGFSATVGDALGEAAGTAFGSAVGDTVGYYAAAAVPIIGWAIAIGALAYSIFGGKGGGPKGGGSASDSFDAAGVLTGHPAVPGTDNGRFFTPSTDDVNIGKLNDATGAGYYQIARGLGGTANAFTFGLGYDTDPSGTANTRVSGDVLGSDGKVIFNDANRDVGKGTDQLPDELTLETEREMLASLQNTNFDQHINDIFKAVGDAATASKADIDAAIQKAEDMETVLTGITKLSGWKGLSVESLQQMQQGSETLIQTFQRVGGEMTSFDDSFKTDAQKLNDAQTAVSDGFTQIGIAVPGSKQQFYDLVHGLDLSTEAGRAMFDQLMAIAPAFLQVSDAVASAATAMQQAVSGFYQAAAGLGGSIGSQFGVAGAQFNLNSAVDAWMAYSPQNSVGHTQASTIQDLSRLTGSSQGIQEILAYAQSFNDPHAVDLATQLITTFGQYQTALNSTTQSVNTLDTAVSSASSGLEDWTKSLLQGSDSPLLPAQKLYQALGDYQTALSSGDQSEFQTSAQALLTAGKAEYASSPEYTALFNRVVQDAQHLGGFALGYQSDVQAANINQMRNDLVVELRISQNKQDALFEQVGTLLQEIKDGSSATVAAIKDSGDATATKIVNAVASMARA